MIQIQDKYGNTSTDLGPVLVYDKYGKLKKIGGSGSGGTGAQGPQGPADGPQGVPGDRGFQGPQGFQGVQGFQGIQGVQGEKGDLGDEGALGPQGPQGRQGSKGDTGDEGTLGERGPQGFQGRQGPQGVQGNLGDSGSQGVQGDLGTQGFQGSQGRQGPRGFQGDEGPQGFQGFQGDLGPQGAQGPQGFQGVQGRQGIQGVQGRGGISAGATYYFNQSQSSDVSPYKVLTTLPNGVQQTLTKTLTGSQQDVLVQQFLTPQLGFAIIPGGTQRFHLHYLKPASNDSIEAYVQIQLADSAGIPIPGTIFTTGASLIGWVDASTPTEVLLDLTLPTTGIDPTNRMIVKLFLSNYDSTTHNVVWYTEGTSYYSFVITTVGVVGNEGEQGPQGPQGPQGFQGVQGVQGVQGTQGTQGFQGPQGFQGVQGPQGFQGFQGVQGTQGFQGPQGFQGFQGFQGPQGTQGFQGPQGDTGQLGNFGGDSVLMTMSNYSFSSGGISGGYIGFNGTNVTNTTQLDISNTDNQGGDITNWNNALVSSTNVVKGSLRISVNGSSNIYADYQILSGSNSTGREQLVVVYIGSNGTINPGDSLVVSFARSGDLGTQGDQGPQGDQGFQGVQGTQGTQGDQGFQGPQGDQGTLGDQGPQGFQGPQGDQGTLGDQGPQGTQGVQGFQGPQGTQGNQGPQGDQGTLGNQGPQGFQGNQGFQGPQGAQGPQGSQGNQGSTASLSPSSYVVKAVKGGSNQTITAGSDQVVTFVDEFDPQNWWTPSKFQPTIAGYYNIQVAVWWFAAATTSGQCNIQLRLNGSTQVAIQQSPLLTGDGYGQEIDIITYFNGSTDYVEVTAYTSNTTSQNVHGESSGTWFAASLLTNGVGPQGNQGTQGTAPTIPRSFGISIDGAGSVISTGIQGDIQIPYSMTINSWTLIADQTGSIVVDVWKNTYANYPATVANTITGSAKPTISSSNKAQSSTLTGWTPSVTAGDIVRFNVDSVSTITKATLIIQGTQT